jgi:uncharacterized damage-inducible protein DinB
MSDIVEPWNIISRVTLYLLDAVQPEALNDRLEPRAWSVGQHFAHLHTIRMMWLEAYQDLHAKLQKVPVEQVTDKAVLRTHLEASAQVVAAMLTESIEAGKVKGFKRSPAAFIGYLVAHESYHHGEIGAILAQSGHRIDKEVAWGMWEWDKR